MNGSDHDRVVRIFVCLSVLPPEVGESARVMASTARQKRSYLHHQGEFQHQNCTVGTVHDSDHDGVVRIFVRHSCHWNELFTLITLIIYAAQFFPYQECNVTSLRCSRPPPPPPHPSLNYCSCYIIDSVESICRDTTYTQYMPIQKNLSKSQKRYTYKPL